MTKYEMMDLMTEQQGGYLLTSSVQEAGISRTYLARFVKEREMEQVETGIYILPETWPDPLYILQLKNKGIVYSHETALYLHGLMDHEPARTTVTVRRGYNASHLIRKGIKPYYVRQEFFDRGVAAVKTSYGNEVHVYDIDRTICDMVQRKDKMDIQVFQTAMKEYMSGERKDIHRLMLYAKMLSVERKVRDYTEMML